MSSRYTSLFVPSSFLLIALSCVVAPLAFNSGRVPVIADRGTPTPSVSEATRHALAASYGQLAMSFEANQGQSDESVKFMARGSGYSLFLTPTEAVLGLRAPTAATTIVRMRLVGANPAPHLTGVDKLPGTTNYFVGNDPAHWQRDVPSYAKVQYADVYPGISQVFYGNQRQLEYDLIVAPHADPARIALAFDGVHKLSIDGAGNLILRTADGDITQQKPVIYQHIDGRRHAVAGEYALLANDEVGFRISEYDSAQPLVIDPVLSYSTFLGGGSNDIGHGIAVDSGGNAYITGETLSTNFPGVGAGSYQPSKLGAANSPDVFVTKLNAAGSAIVYSTYIGGTGADRGHAIAVDGTGAAYITGETDSGTQIVGAIPFPTIGAVQPLYKLGGDAFVTKLSAAGNALVYSTFLGGTERGYGIAVDALGNAYATGHTNSDNVTSGPTGGFPTVNPLQPNNNSTGIYDAFVSKFNPAGSALVFSTYLGGNGNEFSLYGGAIAVDTGGNAYVGGSTGSTNFPGAAGNPIQVAPGGGVSDGFVAKITSTGSFVYSTYLGGNTYDAVHGIAVNSVGEAFVTGYTDSPNFPVFGPTSCVTIYLCRFVILQDTKGIGEDAFVARLNAAGNGLVYSTFLGGNGGDRAYDLAIDPLGNAFVAGWTTSTNFPTADAIQPLNAGSGGDMFVSALSASGSGVLYSTYLGGSVGTEIGRGIAVDSAGNAYLTGDTNSTNFPVAAPLQATRSGSIGTDAVVVKISPPPPPALLPPTNLIVTSLSGSTATITWKAPAGAVRPSGYVLEGGTTPGGVLASLPTNSLDTSYTFSAPTGAFYIRMHALAPGAKSVASNEVRLFINVPAAPSAPVNLLATVNGSALSLAWTNTYSGGPPTGMILDVTGSLNATLGLPTAETFSIGAVASGTYTIALRASNAQGQSAASNSVTVTVPGACSGVPETPENFVVSKNGSLITATWSLPSGGAAPTSYRLFVSGGFTGELAVTERRITGAVGAGTYTVSVAATNACGSGAATAPQTIAIP